jgi:probable F420-dependent oxidoreductase
MTNRDADRSAAPGRPHRFGVNLGRPGDALTPARAARWAEDAGFDIVTAADHVGGVDPFIVLSAAAAVTERVRLRTYVLDVGFWRPVLLARAVSTLDAVSSGRVDLGLGAGHMRHEHEEAGVPFPPLAERVEQMAGCLAQVRRRLADPAHVPAARQSPVPVLVGAMSRAGLDAAARHADIVALSGLLQVPGRPAGTFTLASSAQTDEKVERVREVAGGRRVELDALLQRVVVDADPQESAAAFGAEAGGRITAQELLDSPFVLLSPDPEEAVRELRRREARWGITSWCTHGPSGPALARVVRAMRDES